MQSLIYILLIILSCRLVLADEAEKRAVLAQILSQAELDSITAVALDQILAPHPLARIKQLSDVAIARNKIWHDSPAMNELDPILNLLAMGITPKNVGRIHRWHLTQVVEAFVNEGYDSRLALLFNEDAMLYAINAARKDPEYQTNAESIRAKLKDRLTTRQHMARSGTDYDESLAVIDTVSSWDILYIINRYDALFFAADACSVLAPYFQNQSKVEEGGILLDGDSIELYQVPNHAQQHGKSDAGSYWVNPAQGYMSLLGGMHTHPYTSDRAINEYAGPSGWAKFYEDANLGSSDTANYRYYSEDHPFQVDVVVSEFQPKQFNIDVYFMDVQVKAGKIVRDKDLKVIDLGILDTCAWK